MTERQRQGRFGLFRVRSCFPPLSKGTQGKGDNRRNKRRLPRLDASMRVIGVETVCGGGRVEMAWGGSRMGGRGGEEEDVCECVCVCVCVCVRACVRVCVCVCVCTQA